MKLQLNQKYQRGFTLIELLIVIGIIGVLAAAILVAIDPLEQFAKGRDAGRKSTVTQIGRAVQAYYTSQSAYPPAATWATALTTSGELKVAPALPAPTCTGGTMVGNVCYASSATDVVVYSKQESKADKQKSTGGATVCASSAWFVWTSALGKAGLYCNATPPAAGFNGTIY